LAHPGLGTYRFDVSGCGRGRYAAFAQGDIQHLFGKLCYRSKDSPAPGQTRTIVRISKDRVTCNRHQVLSRAWTYVALSQQLSELAVWQALLGFDQCLTRPNRLLG
jgi:hypothetical protein